MPTLMKRKKSKTRQFCKKAKFKARKSRGVRRTCVRRSDFEMQRKAGIGFFTELSTLRVEGGQ